MKALTLGTHGWSVGSIYGLLRNSSKDCSTLTEIQERIEEVNRSKHQQNDDDEESLASIPKIFGMNEDLQVIQDSCVSPLCRVAQELKEGIRSFSSSTTTSMSNPQSVITLPKGILIVGPSGCGKSHLLKHLSAKITHGSTGGVAVILQDTLSLVQKEVGATETNIHNLFEKARSCAPCVLLLDHIDSIAPPRNSSAFADSSSHVADRMLSTLLIEMDGVKKSERDKYVLVVATATSLDSLDPAVRRPGRLDIHIEVGLPTEEAVFEMLCDGLKPTYENLLLSSGNDDEQKIRIEKEIQGAVRQKAKELLLVDENDDEENKTYADIQAWYRGKVSMLVSKWLSERNNNSSTSTSFKNIDEWLEWLK